MKNNQRKAGVLLHISSLPTKYGIGNFGKSAYEFVDFLKECGASYWQILPLVQTGYGDSPYSSVSCRSGNPYFIDLEQLYRQKLLTKEELKGAEILSDRVDYGRVYATRYPVLRKAFSRFDVKNPAFVKYVKEGSADDYALFMTAKTVFCWKSFHEWEEGIKFRKKEALDEFRRANEAEYLFWCFLQFEFARQWKKLKEYANANGVQIIGDIPLYVALDSADVWAHPELFQLDERLYPERVAGVPPDYFSAEGQLWGNPVYAWERQKKEGFSWWKKRIMRALSLYDVVRIDHFRGLDRYYSVEATAKNAIVGEWADGPKEALFETLPKSARERIIAEDLGTLDEGVYRLLENTQFPGMKVLLFAFDGNVDNAYLPRNIGKNSIAYTGTHDNDTIVGHYQSLDESGKNFLYLQVKKAVKEEKLALKVRKSGTSIANAMVALAMTSKAKLAIVPMQDFMGLDGSCRMNLPGSEMGNWSFRLQKMPSERIKEYVKEQIKRGER